MKKRKANWANLGAESWKEKKSWVIISFLKVFPRQWCEVTKLSEHQCLTSELSEDRVLHDPSGSRNLVKERAVGRGQPHIYTISNSLVVP